jgi:hypothetical protein
MMVRKNLILFTVVCCFIIAGCSSAPKVEIPDHIKKLENLTVISPNTEAYYSIDFTRDAVFGESDEVVLGEITDMAVGNSGGVFIADGDQNAIHSYRPNGQYIQKMGQEGKGPGEFTGLHSVDHQDDRLYAFDEGQRRISVFDLSSLSFSTVIPLAQENRDADNLPNAIPSGFHVRSDGTLLVQFNDTFARGKGDTQQYTPYYLVDQEGKVISDKIHETKLADEIGNSDMMVFVRPPYGRRSLLETGPADNIYSSWTEDFLIKQYNSNGEYQQAIYYPYEKAPLNISELVNEQYDSKMVRDVVRNADSPSTWPAMNSMTVDDQSRLWISTITDDKETYQWWVISSEGELLAKFSWPRSHSLEEVTNGNVYTRETDEETGLEQIVRYSVDMSETD